MKRRTIPGRPAGTVLVGVPALFLGLVGCGSDPPQPGPEAGTAGCTALIGRLPDQVLDRPRTDLAVTGTAGWGDPAIVLRCGVPPTGPTTDPCLEVGGLDWTFTESDAGYRFVSYGRTPAVEVVVPTTVDRTVASGALVDLSDAVKPLPQTARCL